MILVRPETTLDADAIDRVHGEAFGQETEARLVRDLRAEGAFDPGLSLVAVIQDEIEGHILFSRATIEHESLTTPALALALAPLSVRPAFQRRGVGSTLVRAGLDLIRERESSVVVVVGEPRFYERFGFVRASRFGIRPPFSIPDEFFMILASNGAMLDTSIGTVRYAPAFGPLLEPK
jgi:putative acetyltransferase